MALLCKKCGRRLMSWDWQEPMAICLRDYTLVHLFTATLNPRCRHTRFMARLHNLKADIRQIIRSEFQRYTSVGGRRLGCEL